MREFLTLLIEDDENDIFFLEHAMKKAGWPGVMKVVRDGAEGIAYLTGAGAFGDRAQYPLPSLVILDLNLPVKTGLEVLQLFRKYRPRKRGYCVHILDVRHRYAGRLSVWGELLYYQALTS